MGNARLLCVSVGFTSGNVPHGRSVSWLFAAERGRKPTESFSVNREERQSVHLTAACISASGMSGLHFSQPGEAGGAVEPALTPQAEICCKSGLQFSP